MAAPDALVYSSIQAVHNLNGAVALGIPLMWLWYRPHREPRRTLVLLALVWVVQAASGALFGLASLTLYGALPDLHPIAWGALAVKVSCVAAALGLILSHFMFGTPAVPWSALTAFAVLALAAAAVLRWAS